MLLDQITGENKETLSISEILKDADPTSLSPNDRAIVLSQLLAYRSSAVCETGKEPLSTTNRHKTIARKGIQPCNTLRSLLLQLLDGVCAALEQECGTYVLAQIWSVDEQGRVNTSCSSKPEQATSCHKSVVPALFKQRADSILNDLQKSFTLQVEEQVFPNVNTYKVQQATTLQTKAQKAQRYLGTAGPSEQTSQLSHNEVSHSEIFPPIDDIHTRQPLQRHDSSIYDTFSEPTLSFLEEINRLDPSVSTEPLQRNDSSSIWDGMEDFSAADLEELDMLETSAYEYSKRSRHDNSSKLQ